jgi:nitrogen-specific signal transduction histidine kinase
MVYDYTFIDKEFKTKTMTEVKEKKTRTPKNAESITKGAANLSLEDKIKLRDYLTEIIAKENDAIQTMAERFNILVNGK